MGESWVFICQQFDLPAPAHGGLLAVVPPHLRVLPVGGGEEEHRYRPGDQEEAEAAEAEGEEGDQNPASRSVTPQR